MNQNQPQPTPSITPSKPKNKVYWIILIVVAVLVIGGAIYIVWQGRVTLPKVQDIIRPSKPSPTADWLTYRNESAKFEIKYPQDWYHENEMPVNGIGYEIFIGSFLKNGKKFCHLNISPYKTERFENRLKGYYSKYETLLSQGTEVDINGVSAIKVPTRPEYFRYHYWIKREDGKYYSFDIGVFVEKLITNEEGHNVYMHGDEFYTECSDIFNQMLSTFKFIK